MSDDRPDAGQPLPPLPASATAEHGSPRAAAASPRNRLAAGVRRVSDLLVGRPLEDGDLEQAAEALERVARELAAAAGPGKAPRGMPDHRGHPQDFFPTSPVVGYHNPLAPPVDVWAVRADDGALELRGRAFYRYPYEGPPTCVHGGVIAELFDELLGAMTILNGTPGMTGTLTVRYRRPTPLLAPLDLEARITSVEGRKIFARGVVRHDGEPTAEAEGVFIAVWPQKMLDILTVNARDDRGELVDAELRSFIERGGEIRGVDGPPPA
ncbi:MAG: PaaI family thioesterase [Acidimicrobiales bacterium]